MIKLLCIEYEKGPLKKSKLEKNLLRFEKYRYVPTLCTSFFQESAQKHRKKIKKLGGPIELIDRRGSSFSNEHPSNKDEISSSDHDYAVQFQPDPGLQPNNIE
uniref:Uncharacterized protein n=1 Tax=Romanomermis culicivorax TaxID=13658 RepID=A0A915KBM4_ROMCU